jgi:hypothetical protein
MRVPIKTVLPTLEKWSEKNSICGIAHDLMSSFQTDYKLKLREMLLLKWSEDDVEKIVTYFYDKYQHSTPIFARNMEGQVPLRVTITDLDYDGSEPKKSSGMLSMLGI